MRHKKNFLFSIISSSFSFLSYIDRYWPSLRFLIYALSDIAYVTRHRAITHEQEALSFSHPNISNYITFISVARRRRFNPTFHVRRFLFFFIVLDQTCSSHRYTFRVRCYDHNSAVRDVNIDVYNLRYTPTYTSLINRCIHQFFWCLKMNK